MKKRDIGKAKPHLFYNRALCQWVCFQWGIGYLYGGSMHGVYMKWRDLSGIISRIGA